ncbi:hypothetical protein HDE_14452 [Halotydeus destructor]|nr:hypothetical protein HDE_14452 [Halotydeus destructor]
MERKKTAAILIYIISALAFLYYCYLILSGYLAYKTVTTLGTLVDKQSPSVSLCFPITDVLAPKYADHSLAAILSTYQAAKIIQDVTTDTVFRDDDHESFLVGPDKCYLHSQLPMTLNSFTIHFVIPNKEMRLRLYLTQSLQYLRGQPTSSRLLEDMISSNDSLDVIDEIVYSQSKTILLPAPYETDCRYYVRDLCMEQCYKQLLGLNSFGLYYGSQEYVNIDSHAIDKEPFCLIRCQKPDCIENSFNLNIVNYKKQESLDDEDKALSIRFRLDKASFLLEHHAQIAFYPFVMYLVGLLGTFFGISFLDTKVIFTLSRFDQHNQQCGNRLSLHHIFTGVFFICCAIHFIYTTLDYLEYDISTITDVTPAKWEYLPSYSLCTEPGDTAWLTNPSLAYNSTNMEKLLGNLDGNMERMAARVFGLERFEKLHLFWKDKALQIEKFLYHGRYCLRFSPFNATMKLTPYYYSKNFYLINNPEVHRRWGTKPAQVAYAHARDDYPRLDNHPVVYRDSQILQLYVTTIHRLETPYRSQCRNYSAEHMPSRGQCVDTCASSLYQEENGDGHFPLDIPTWNCTGCTAKGYARQFQEICTIAHCKHLDCTSNLYSLERFSQQADRQVTEISFKDTDNREITVKEYPKWQVVDYIFFVIGILGIWLELSFQNVFDFFGIIKPRIPDTRQKWLSVATWVTHFVILIGFIWNFHGTASVYFDYDTLSKTVIGEPDVCHRPLILLQQRQQTDTCNNHFFYNMGNCTVADRLKQSQPIDELVDTMWILSNQTYQWKTYRALELKQLERSREISTHFNLQILTFRLINVLQHNREYDILKLKYNAEAMEIAKLRIKLRLVQLTLTHTIKQHGSILFREKMLTIQPPFDAKVHFEFWNSLLSYEVVKSLLLGPPYGNCLNYKTQGYQDRADCLHQCKYQLFSERYPGQVAYDDTVVSATDTGRMASRVDSDNGMLSNHTLKSICYEQRCSKPDCQSLSFNPKILSIDKTSNATSSLVTILANKYEVDTKQAAKFPLVELFIYIGGIVGLWYGFAVINVFDFLVWCHEIGTSRDTPRRPDMKVQRSIVQHLRTTYIAQSVAGSITTAPVFRRSTSVSARDGATVRATDKGAQHFAWKH